MHDGWVSFFKTRRNALKLKVFGGAPPAAGLIASSPEELHVVLLAR